jgi:hypothetical protein
LIQINARKIGVVHFRSRIGMTMNEPFQALTLNFKEAKAAYPLIYLHDASISLGEWLRFARRRCRGASGRAGLIAIRDRRDITHALFAYRVDIDLRAHRRLCLNNFVVARMPGAMIDQAVRTSISELASRLACRTISVDQPFRQNDTLLVSRLAADPGRNQELCA